jgi:hypothetical protein
MSHYVPMDAPSGPGDTQLAVCHQWVSPHDHALAPTCPVCQQILADEDASLAALTV